MEPSAEKLEIKLNQNLVNLLGLKIDLKQATPNDFMLIELKLRKLYQQVQWVELAKVADKIADAVCFLTGDDKDDIFRTSEEINLKIEGVNDELGKIDSIQ